MSVVGGNDYLLNSDDVDKSKKRHAGKIDGFIGSKLRNARILLGITQEQLSKKLGITFQQLQKYENGINRISCATIYLVSEILNISVSDFFPVYKLSGENRAMESRKTLKKQVNRGKEISSLLDIFNKIESIETKKRILAIVQQFSKYNKKD